MSKQKSEKTVTKDNLIIDICNFIDSLKGKVRIVEPEAKQLFNLYNTYYNSNETNYSCELCVIRVYAALEQIKNSYEQRKEKC